MTDLGQQQLLEPDKPRSMIVAKGCGCWWGVDPSTRCVAIGWATAAGETGVQSETFPRMDSMPRLSVIYDGARQLAERVARGHAAPGMIGVEQPSGSGQQVNHELEFAVGCIIAGIYDGVRAVASPAAMQLVVGSFWKKAACGNGAIRKTHRVEGRRGAVSVPFEEYEVLKWARLNGYAGGSWDEADALAIAVAMQRTWDLVER